MELEQIYENVARSDELYAAFYDLAYGYESLLRNPKAFAEEYGMQESEAWDVWENVCNKIRESIKLPEDKFLRLVNLSEYYGRRVFDGKEDRNGHVRFFFDNIKNDVLDD